MLGEDDKKKMNVDTDTSEDIILDDENDILNNDNDGADKIKSAVESSEEKPVRRKERRTASRKDISERDLDATRLYLGEIGFSALLNAEEEVTIARRKIGRAHV